MQIKLIVQTVTALLPKLIGLAGYKDSNKNSNLGALLDGSKFATFVIILLGLGISLLPHDMRMALIETITLFGATGG